MASSRSAKVKNERNRSIFDFDSGGSILSHSSDRLKDDPIFDTISDKTGELGSDSESSSDEFSRPPFSLKNLEDFKSNKELLDIKSFQNQPENEEPTSLEQHPNEVSEYFDFTSIIKSQELLKNISAKKVKPRKQSQKDNQKVVPNNLEKLNVSELLAIGEKETNYFVKAESLNEEVKEEKVKVVEEHVGSKGIQITIPLPNSHLRKKTKPYDIEAALRRRLNAVKRENQVYVHQTHLLCLIAHGNYLNITLNSEEIMAVALSILPSEKCYPPKHADISYLEKLVNWFSKKITLLSKLYDNSTLHERILDQFKRKEADSVKDLTLMFIIILRVLGLKCRLIISLQPVPLKPPSSVLLTLPKGSENGTKKCDNINNYGGSTEDSDFETPPSKSRKKATVMKKNNKAQNSQNEVSCSYFNSSSSGHSQERDNNKTKCSPKIKKTTKTKFKGSSPNKGNVKPVKGRSKTIDRRVLSSGSETDSKTLEKKKKIGNDIWLEVFLESEEKYISVDIRRGKVHCVHQLYSGATHPVLYILAWNNDNSIKDLTPRYAPQWMTVTRKHRIEASWWEKTLLPWKPKLSAIEKEENRDLDCILAEKPLPASIAEYKNHPLYALQRHLLKFEAIYPPNAPTLGFVKKEPVYSRLCVAGLHSRETWMRKAKLVRINETPYKIVKARPKYDKMSGTVMSDLPLELFGEWQTEDYIAPPAVDGKVPRNEYGNVEVYKPCMIPPGTVHLQVPGLNRVARKLDIDCAPAVVGWEYHSGGSHPILDGFIVCEEFKEILLDAWNKEIDESAKRAKEKVEQKVYGNWKRLIRGLLIRERLQQRYKFGVVVPENNKKKPCKRKHSK